MIGSITYCRYACIDRFEADEGWILFLIQLLLISHSVLI